MTGIKRARLDAGFTAVALAKKLGVCRSTIHGWESQRAVPDMYTAIYLAKILNTTVEELARNTPDDN